MKRGAPAPAAAVPEVQEEEVEEEAAVEEEAVAATVEEEPTELEVEFDLFNQTDKDKLAIKELCKNLLCGAEYDVDSLADAAIAADVGSVVKSEGYVDALALITVLDMADSRPWAAEIASRIGLTAAEVGGMGLLLNQRIVNMPTLRLAPAMHRSLFTEVDERGPGAKCFTKYLVIAHYYESAEAPRGTAKAGKTTEYVRPEEELYAEASERTLQLPRFVPEGGDPAGKLTFDGSVVVQDAVALIVDAKKIPAILRKMETDFA